jgi:hypothetical protein
MPVSLLLLLFALPPQPEATPGPTPALPAAAPAQAGLPAFVASLEVAQGERRERVALFADGTIARSVRNGDAPAELRRKTISREELELLTRVIAGALDGREASRSAPALLVDGSRRRITIEIARPEGEAARFEFGDLSQISLELGRARGALEDLAERFDKTLAMQKGSGWNPSQVKEGDLLKRIRDGLVFRVVRDDALSPFIELEEAGRRLERMKVPRRELPRNFEEPEAEGAAPPR